eukprot:459982-Prorocentrum_minimum.AAC.2
MPLIGRFSRIRFLPRLGWCRRRVPVSQRHSMEYVRRSESGRAGGDLTWIGGDLTWIGGDSPGVGGLLGRV